MYGMFKLLSFMSVALTIGLLTAASPASAQQVSDALQQSITNATFENLAPHSSFLVTGLASTAQDEQSTYGRRRHSGVGFGAELGPIFSSFDEAQHDFKNNNGIEGGIFFGGNRDGVVGLLGKILYAKKGAKDSMGGSGVDLHYLEIPILLRVNAGSGSVNGVRLYGLVGPAFDIKLKASLFDGTSVSDQYQGLDIGLQFGAGIDITRFLIEGVYTKGLRNIAKDDFFDSEKITTHSFALLFGLRFN
jgi:hypothetical protein